MGEGREKLSDKTGRVDQRQNLLIAICIDGAHFQSTADQSGAGGLFISGGKQHFAALKNPRASGRSQNTAFFGCQDGTGRRIADGAIFT